MSIDGTKLLFEGFLQKRKDTMLRWSTYWFRLQNTTLFFYSQKNGSASHLRGYYYIYTVQSVREVSQRVSRRRFVFEITMTNGKKKVLAAETADLRKEWVGNLWKSMQLSNSRITGAERLCEQRDADGSVASSVPSSEEPIYQNPTDFTQQDNGQRLNCAPGLSGQTTKDNGDYDFLPLRNAEKARSLSEKECVEDECLYDFPASNRIAVYHQASEQTEGIYDVPSSLLRKMSDHTLDDLPEEGRGPLEELMSSLKTPETDWSVSGGTPDSQLSVYL
ncbi:uncharacterized protein LOC142989285 isoform X3 [Genypterus blacodes]|uniref:uncharacterized protein LOC142989285 isoform X3 n=1 Tax=Genypterus blacodes TaxID=154954 RepID=UPI003F778224